MYRRSSATIASAFAVLTWLALGCDKSNSGDDDSASGSATGGSSATMASGGNGAGSGGSNATAHPGSGGHVGSMSGSGGATASGSGGMKAPPSGGTGGASATSDGGMMTMMDASSDAGGDGDTWTGPETGSFPAITDAWSTGPFAVTTMPGGPSGTATVLYPRDLGKDGLKHPIVVWDNGAGQTGLSIYGDLLNHIASHGFAVYAANSATDQGTELTEGLDWMIAQNDKSDSPFYQKLDPTMTAAMGHSQGSIATFAIAADPRLKTTLHLSGGTNPDIAEGHATLPNLHHPAAFLCGEPGGDGLVVGDTASEWCLYDFQHTDVPVFLVQVTGASHISAPGMMTGACAGWLRWWLMHDSTMKKMFTGPDCTLCMRPSWVTMSKGLD
jgi:hypothetical protein